MYILDITKSIKNISINEIKDVFFEYYYKQSSYYSYDGYSIIVIIVIIFI